MNRNRTAAMLASAVLAVAFCGAAAADDTSKADKSQAKSEYKQRIAKRRSYIAPSHVTARCADNALASFSSAVTISALDATAKATYRLS